MNKLNATLRTLLTASCLLAAAPFATAHSGSATQTFEGAASWYGPGFHGRQTANGETYDMNSLTAAHPSLPFGTRVRVTNEATNESVVVRINDRGPYAKNRIIDLSKGAADDIGLLSSGVGHVTVEVLASA
ncbi:septal ring lytic transglycosylase RlpA family protein [Limimaricola sp. G21655-S1]|uniref:septal ring lytic transglycosylase RlpA family protein n=1 Tax=unclassified Limimaricola TaxID=2626459 RepID=UPI0022AF8889|nr:septal ring lytic transglycosylase RlpA family protein [Limimaricola sp. G21655-S1]MCZ4260067.1 septal ring lytic transglycosylase RlpA family protein [Limimaricola sp. G21655-S1]